MIYVFIHKAKTEDNKFISNLLATPDAFGSLCVFFICSIRASAPKNSLWQIGQDVALGPPINAACCCNTPKCSCSSCFPPHHNIKKNLN